jgi:hypothetical protein
MLTRLSPAPIRTSFLSKTLALLSPTWEKWFRDLVTMMNSTYTQVNNGTITGTTINIGLNWRLREVGDNLNIEYKNSLNEWKKASSFTRQDN